MSIETISKEKHVDYMSIGIEKNREKPDYVDYVYICNVYGQDPRYAHKYRGIKIGENRGLFRISKETLEPELLISMEGDESKSRYFRAFGKVIRVYKETSIFPDKTGYQCG
ncbi:MAG: hypothetical protein K0R66_1241 [Gammaproteobacteria bacterium]|jgi:hypothetical protein|nr:hypothetical protein [Gammaproteobacteria bacterium]